MRKRYSEKDSYTKQLTNYIITHTQNPGMLQMASNQTVAQYFTQVYPGGPPGRAQYSNTMNTSNIHVGRRGGHLSQNE